VINSNHQSGNFTVEFAIVGILFGMLIAFSGDVVVKLAIKGKLDRMSYSAASIAKERTQLFAQNYIFDKSEGDNLYTIVENSLKRTMGSFDSTKFGMAVNVYTYTTEIEMQPYSKGDISCDIPTPSESLFITTSWGRRVTLYQVTLCYEIDNWFGSLIKNKNYNRVQSHSIIMGR
jgi:tight adherence protein F